MKRLFTEEQIYAIRVRYCVRHEGVKRIATSLDVNRKVIWDIVNFRTYKTSPGPRPARERICPRCRQILKRA